MSARKTVIFIGGSSYSGSTLLDMVLANSEMGFSCGEITALFYPYRDHHLAPICGCGSTNCTVWEIVRQRGLKNIYETIFDLFKDVNYIVDSSKDPLWIHDRTKDLQHGGIVVKNILIWKTPAEFFESKKKRGKTLAWRRAWINYHRLYFYLVKEWVGLPYRQLVTDPGVLERVCEYLEIPYSNRQFDYWEKCIVHYLAIHRQKFICTPRIPISTRSARRNSILTTRIPNHQMVQTNAIGQYITKYQKIRTI